MIDRYGIDEFEHLEPADDGDYVDYEDHLTEVEVLKNQLSIVSDVLEAIKVALNRPGTDRSYVEWAKELRDAYDDKLSGWM